MEGNQDGRILKVGVLQLGKVLAAMGGLFGLIALFIIGLGSAIVPNMKFQMLFLLMPVGAILGGFIGGCFVAFISNIALKLSNGVELAFDGIPPEGGGGSDEQTEKQSA